MTRKDNNFVTLWNEGFRKMQSSGAFAKMCKEAENKYGNILMCFWDYEGFHKMQSSGAFAKMFTVNTVNTVNTVIFC